MEQKNLVVYEYMSKSATTEEQAKIIDIYESLGYEVTSIDAGFNINNVNFKRNRQIPQKNELCRLERRINELLASERKLETSKSTNARIFAFSFGIVSALILGLGMVLTMLYTNNVALFVIGVIVGVIGLILCAINYPCYKKMLSDKSAKVEALLQEYEDKLATTQEQAQILLAAK